MKKLLIILNAILCMIAIVSCSTAEKTSSGLEEGTTTAKSIFITSKQTIYPKNIDKITVLWNNNSKNEVTFGNMFTLDKKVGEEWVEVSPNAEATFTTEGIILLANKSRKHTYNLTLYENLKAGCYRINTSYIDKKIDYPIYFEFTLK